MKDRIIKNWKTSVIGIVLLAFAGVLVWFQKITLGEFTAFLPTVFGLLWVKDTFVSSMFNKGGGAAVIAIMLLTLNSCVTYERCIDKYGKTSSDTIKVPFKIEVPFYIALPADSNAIRINIDSIRYLITDQVYHKADSVSKIQIQYWKDKINYLYFSASIPADTIHDTLVKDTVVPCPPQVYMEDKPGRFELFWEKYKTAAGYLLPALLVIIALLTGILLRKSTK